jgi:hypothetical protein
MSKNKFFLQQYSFENFFHGGIGYSDAEKILEANEFIPVKFPYHHSFSIWAKISRGLYFFKTLLKIKKGDTVVFIFPVFAKVHRLLLHRLYKKENLHLICIVADIDGIKDSNQNLLSGEINELKQYKHFIAHNDSMKHWLQGHFPGAGISCIEFFDFLATPFGGNREKTKDIVFAGNLEKSVFLENLYLLNDMFPALHFNLYGPGCTNKVSSQANVSYKGVMEPHKLPGSVEGSFGLIWDGSSIDGPGGSLGEYMRYISHHKLSLYILSGLPLIVPAMAASAALVKKYKIGVTINSLHEIDSAIGKISEGDYQQMRENMKPLAQKISGGKCLTQAIEELVKSM